MPGAHQANLTRKASNDMFRQQLAGHQSFGLGSGARAGIGLGDVDTLTIAGGDFSHIGETSHAAPGDRLALRVQHPVLA